jgi:hypothetical protein
MVAARLVLRAQSIILARSGDRHLGSIIVNRAVRDSTAPRGVVYNAGLTGESDIDGLKPCRHDPSGECEVSMSVTTISLRSVK